MRATCIAMKRRPFGSSARVAERMSDPARLMPAHGTAWTPVWRGHEIDFVGANGSVTAETGETMAETGNDDFMATEPLNRRSIFEITEALTLALQCRGLVRYDGGHAPFRDNMLAF